MRKKTYIKNLFNLVIIFLLFPCFINSQSTTGLSVSFANFDVLRQHNSALESRVEYRFGEVNYEGIPFVGVMVNTDKASFIYGGISRDIKIFEKLYFSPSFAPGLYFQGDSKNLDFYLEFRSQIEITYQVQENLRLGFNFNHISNGGLSFHNPGVESLGFTYIYSF